MDKEPQQALQDLAYIKQLLARNQKKLDHSPPFLYIWGSYMTLGYIGMEFDTTWWPAWFWSCGTIVASIITAIVGAKLPKHSSTEVGGSYSWMFWLPFAVTLLCGTFMMATGMVREEYISVFWCALIGIGYVSLGALIGKGPVILGIWFVVLAILTRLLFLDYQFLMLGLFGGGSVILAGVLLQLLRRRKHG